MEILIIILLIVILICNILLGFALKGLSVYFAKLCNCIQELVKEVQE